MPLFGSHSIYLLQVLWIDPFPNKPWILHAWSISLLKTLWEKEKLLVTSNFSFSHSVFYLFWITFRHFHQIWNCRLQTLLVWKCLKFVVWERVKTCVKVFCTAYWFRKIQFKNDIFQPFWCLLIVGAWIYYLHSLFWGRISRISGYLDVKLKSQIKLLLFAYQY